MARYPQTRKRKARRGQTIVVGSIGLFIMTLGVISTLNIGHAVSERIRLQNAADAAAYSLAAEEARLFNFFAFTNRAQVAHYSAAMTVQSYMSYLTYVGGLVGSLRDVIWNAASVYQCICDRHIHSPVDISTPYCILAESFIAFGETLAMSVLAIHEVLQVEDEHAADVVEALLLFNQSLWRAQLQQGLKINMLLTSGGYPYVEHNDPAVDFGILNGFNALFNQLEFNKVFDRGAGLNFSLIGLLSHPSEILNPRIEDSSNTDEDVQAARAVMTEIANASRWGPSGNLDEHFVTDRSDALPVPTVAMIAWLTGEHHGQTRMVSGENHGLVNVSDHVEVDEIRADSDGSPTYYTGSVIASDDYFDRSSGLASTGLIYVRESRDIGSAILADEEGGVHYGYEHTDEAFWSMGTMRLPADVPRMVNYLNFFEMGCSMACCTEVEETFPSSTDDDYNEHEPLVHNHPGIAPYPKFNPDPDELNDYNQPNTWIFLNKPPENFNRFGTEGQQPWSLDFEMTLGNETMSLDTTPGVGDSALFDFLEGLNAISRGQCYYHRPRPAGGILTVTGDDSNWQEHPNFFNPFWRARLAPVGQKLKQLYDRYVSNELHVDQGAESDPVLSSGANVVRNLLGDVFFHTVTSVMTH